MSANEPPKKCLNLENSFQIFTVSTLLPSETSSMTSETSIVFEQTAMQIKLPNVDNNKFTVKYPTKMTLGADLLLELRNNSDASKWLIPVQRRNRLQT